MLDLRGAVSVSFAGFTVLGAASCLGNDPLLATPPDGSTNTSDGGGERDAAPPTDACATATWLVQHGGRVPLALGLDPTGRLFAAGNAGNQGWLAELDRCDGHIVKDILFPAPEGKTSARVLAIVVTDTEIHVAGDVNNNGGGLYGTFDKGLKKLTLTSYAAGGISFLGRIARAKDGTVWLGGGRSQFEPTHNGWVIRVGGKECKAGTAVAGIAPTDTGKLVALIESGEVARLAEVSADCVVKELPTPLALAEQGPPNYLTAVGDTYYAVGGAGGTNHSNYGYLAARSVSSGWTVAPPLDPNPQFADRLLRIESDGAGLFAGGSQNESLTGGTPAVYRYDLPLSDKSTPVWNTVPFGAQLFNIQDLKVPPRGDDTFYVAGAPRPDPTAGAIARCRKSTGCDAK